jgi:hypothetical protein
MLRGALGEGGVPGPVALCDTRATVIPGPKGAAARYCRSYHSIPSSALQGRASHGVTSSAQLRVFGPHRGHIRPASMTSKETTVLSVISPKESGPAIRDCRRHARRHMRSPGRGAVAPPDRNKISCPTGPGLAVDNHGCHGLASARAGQAIWSMERALDHHRRQPEGGPVGQHRAKPVTLRYVPGTLLQAGARAKPGGPSPSELA